MARFTKIPETNLAGMLGGIAGQAAGTVISNAGLSIEKLQASLDPVCKKILDGNQTGYRELEEIEKTLEKTKKTVDTLDKTIAKVEKTTQALNTTASSVKIPITALKVAINIIEYLPMPQAYLVTSVSALQASMVQMLSELVAQIEQIVLTISIVIKIILGLLKKLKDALAALRKVIATAKACLALLRVRNRGDSSDRKALEDIGVLDKDGNCIFNKLLSVTGDVTDIIWLGDYSGIDTGSLAVESQVKSTESGTTIDVIVSSVGDWVTRAYCESGTRPEKPVGRELVPKGWTDKPKAGPNAWVSKGTVVGSLGKVSSWTEPERSLVLVETSNIKSTTKEVTVYRVNSKLFKVSNFSTEGTIAIVLTGANEAYQIMLKFLQAIDESSVSSELKDQLQIEINPQEDQPAGFGETEDTFISRSGEVYKLTLKTSSVSPKIATQRYVDVTDESGALVYEGPLTFATDSSVIFEDTKVRLVQLLN